eukprot:1610402-Lingulodinium_polyedra.AAC.1
MEVGLTDTLVDLAGSSTSGESEPDAAPGSASADEEETGQIDAPRSASADGEGLPHPDQGSTEE